MTFLEMQTMFANYVDDVNFGYYTLPFAKTLLNKNQKEVHKILIANGEQRYMICKETDNSNNACNYTVKRNRLWVFPTPASVYRLRLYYNFLLPDMILDTDEPDIQENYQELIVLYAVRDAFIKDDRESQKILDKINRYETEMKNDAQERRKDSPRYIKVTEGDFFF
jgi:hypothetical protein